MQLPGTRQTPEMRTDVFSRILFNMLPIQPCKTATPTDGGRVALTTDASLGLSAAIVLEPRFQGASVAVKYYKIRDTGE